MKNLFIISSILLWGGGRLFAQVGVNTQNPSAALDIVSKDNTSATKALEINNSSNTEMFTVLNNGQVGVGTSSPNAKLDIRTNPTSTSNPGEGMLGLGTTTAMPSTAGAGALRYNTISGGILEYSNGMSWNTLTSTVSKSLVVAKKWNTTQTINNNASATISQWTEDYDNNNSFNPTSGIFTAARSGIYVISGTLGLPISNNYIGWIETIIVIRNASGTELASYKSPIATNSTGGVFIMPGATITITLFMNAGETAELVLFNSTGNSRTLRYNNGSDTASNGFNNFSIVEL